MSQDKKNSPSLEVISSESTDSRLERRRIPRLDLTSDLFKLDENNRVYGVLNVSIQGMAIHVLEREDLISFSVGREIAGILSVRREKMLIKAHVSNLRQNVVGCEFRDLDPGHLETLELLLDPERMGAELKLMPSGNAAAFWYHGPSGTDIMLWRQPGTPAAEHQYNRITVFILGSFFQWESEFGLSSGRTMASDENSETLGIVRLATMLLDRDPEVDPGKLSVAKKLILSSNLPQDLKDVCSKRLFD